MENNKPKKSPLIFIIIFLLIITTAVSVYFYFQYQKTRSLLTDSTITAQSEIKKLINDIGRHIELPKDESPGLATVTDKNKLANQAFFTKAQNGDKVLIYQKSSQAILYRPSIDKIIKVSAIKSDPIAPGVKSDTKNEEVKMAIYNGSDVNDFIEITENQITGKFPEIKVVKRVNSGKTYPKTSVIDIKGNQKNLVKKIADYLLGEVAFLPQGEATPEADILLILGKNN